MSPDEETLERNKKKRGTIRSVVTKLIKKIVEELSCDNPKPEALQDSLTILLEREIALYKLDEVIESQTPTDELECEVESVMEYSQEIILCASRTKRYLENIKVSIELQEQCGIVKNDSDSQLGNAVVNASETRSVITTTKLPRITLDKFSGDVCKFQEFWPQYKAAIHENNSLQTIEKFTYLKSLLSDSAERAISGLPLTCENYKKAVEILVDRFGNKQVLINAHMNRLLRLEPVRRSNDVLALRKLHDEISVQIRSLESLEIFSDSYGCLLLPILYKSIPNDLVLQYNRQQTDDKDSNVTDLLAFLKRETEAREKSQNMTSACFEDSTQSENKFYKQRGENKFYKPYYKTKFSPQVPNQAQPRIASAMTLNTVEENTCPFCSDQATRTHKPIDCKLTLEQRRKALKRQAKCFRCFKKYHRSFLCRDSSIFCSLCRSKQHNNLLCPKQLSAHVKESPTPTKTNLTSEPVLTSLTHPSREYKLVKDSYVYFQTVRCMAVGRNKMINIRLLLDSASSRTFLCKDISQSLGLEKVDSEALKIHTFGTAEAELSHQNRVRVLLKDIYSENCLCVEALETESICANIIRAPSSELQKQVEDLGLNLADTLENGETPRVDMLVGADFYWSVLTGKNQRISSNVVLNESRFGWILHGRISETIHPNNIVGAMFVSVWDDDDSEDIQASKQLQRFWNLESLGIADVIEPSERALRDKQTMEIFENSIQFKNNRYEAKLPFKSDTIFLPNNYENAKRRFQGLIKRFQNNPTLFKDYKTVLDEYLSLGIVERIEPQEIDSTIGNLIYYLPHHPVIRNDKCSSKLRIVFDASSNEANKPSLNDSLLPGPNLNVDLFDLLLQFRSNKIAVVSDIEKAFLNISLVDSDRDVTRFLWIDELPQNQEFSVNPIILRMTRVLFGVTSSPFLLRAVIQHHLKKFESRYPDTCSVVGSSMYVDDFLAGKPSVQEALQLSKEARDIFLEASMSLRKWQSNSSVLKEHLKTLDFNVVSEESTRMKPFKVLGLIWNTENDTFRIDSQSLLEFINCESSTKRTVLKASGRIYDPSGYLSAFTLIAKIIFQQLWERGIDWDEHLPSDLQKEWDKWCAQIPFICKVEVPRFYFHNLQGHFPENVELHCFTDSSERAYGAICYLRFATTDNIHTSFVTSKCRLAPVKRLTLPRLELLGALIGARLCNRVRSVLNYNLNGAHLWMDSTIVLHWIRSSSSCWKPFVSNRVSEIQTLTDPVNWKHCPGRQNPADRLTRGLSILELEKDDLWWSGPPWLIQEKKFWPKELIELTEEQKQLEARRTNSDILQNLCTSVQMDPVVSTERFSSLTKLVRVMAWIKRFLHNARSPLKRVGGLSAEELLESEIYLIKQVQAVHYREEISLLQRNLQIGGKSQINSLRPSLDEDNLLRIGTRLTEADLEPNEINPIILPKKDRLTELLVKREHEKMMHSGISSTLSLIRRHFWIPQGRQLVKKIIGRCLVCKRFTAKPANQLTGQLPKDRISESPPFSVIGVDFAGPIHVKAEKTGTSKSYIALFTCAVTRAVHLELVTTMSTKSFMLSFRRFLARRGSCKVIYSDNAKTFKSADRELQRITKILKDHHFREFISSQGVTWKFIVPSSPWWGGFYERLVKSVKDPLRKVLKRALLTFEEMTTLLSEIESVVNMRPLTYTSNDAGDVEPLTPSNFLTFGRKEFNFPLHFADLENKISTKETLIRRKRYQTRLLELLWIKWKEQYLLHLNTAHLYKTSKVHNDLKQGEVVLVDGIHKSKLLWDLGVVQEVLLGRDNHVRACVVKTSRGTYRKPVQLLYPLELDNDT